MFEEIKEAIFGPKFEKVKCESLVRQAMSRINIHRSKRMNSKANVQADILKHLKAMNEDNASIWVETLIHDEGMIICYDVCHILLD